MKELTKQTFIDTTKLMQELKDELASIESKLLDFDLKSKALSVAVKERFISLDAIRVSQDNITAFFTEPEKIIEPTKEVVAPKETTKPRKYRRKNKTDSILDFLRKNKTQQFRPTEILKLAKVKGLTMNSLTAILCQQMKKGTISKQTLDNHPWYFHVKTIISKPKNKSNGNRKYPKPLRDIVLDALKEGNPMSVKMVKRAIDKKYHTGLTDLKNISTRLGNETRGKKPRVTKLSRGIYILNKE